MNGGAPWANLEEAVELMDSLSASSDAAKILEYSDIGISQFPGEAYFWLKRGHSLVSLGRLVEAVDGLSVALERWNAEPALHFFRGLWQLKLSCYQESVQDFSNAIAAEANVGASYYSESAKFARGVAHLYVMQFEEAERDCSEVRQDMQSFVNGQLWSVDRIRECARARRMPSKSGRSGPPIPNGQNRP